LRLIAGRESMLQVAVEESKRRALRDSAQSSRIYFVGAAAPEVEPAGCVNLDLSCLVEERCQQATCLRPGQRAERRSLGGECVGVVANVMADGENETEVLVVKRGALVAVIAARDSDLRGSWLREKPPGWNVIVCGCWGGAVGAKTFGLPSALHSPSFTWNFDVT
jgi:hypothetical protein